jgi:RNA polymerase sigma-70 factor (ECF subfamily)
MWPDAQQVERCLNRARAGDEQALDELLSRCREPLRRAVGLRLDPKLAHREDASDVVQKTLVEAHRRFRDYLKDPRMPFTLWLRHIAQDRIIDTHRRHQAAGRRSIDREQAEAAAPDASSVMLVAHLMDQELTPASAAVQRELTDRLEQVMAELDDPDREILLMRYYEQMSNQEIAATLNLTEAAASMRHLRALRRLKEAFLRWTRDVGSVDESTSG